MLVKALTTSWATAWSKPKDPLYVETTTIRFRLVDLGGGHEVFPGRLAVGDCPYDERSLGIALTLFGPMTAAFVLVVDVRSALSGEGSEGIAACLGYLELLSQTQVSTASEC